MCRRAHMLGHSRAVLTCWADTSVSISTTESQTQRPPLEAHKGRLGVPTAESQRDPTLSSQPFCLAMPTPHQPTSWCNEGTDQLGPQSREERSSNLSLSLASMTGCLPFLSLEVLGPLGTYMHRVPPMAEPIHTGKIQVKQENHLLYSGFWKLQCESEKNVTGWQPQGLSAEDSFWLL